MTWHYLGFSRLLRIRASTLKWKEKWDREMMEALREHWKSSLPLETRDQSMEGTAYLQGCHICLPCSMSSRKLLAYDPPPQPPGKAGSWAFGIISYFINGLNSHSWGQLEGLLDLIMLERESARNASHGQERGSRERTSKQKGDVMGYESCYSGWGAETMQHPREQNTSSWAR